MIISGKIKKIHEERGKPILIEVKIRKIEAKVLNCNFSINFSAEEILNLFENYSKDDLRMKEQILQNFEENLKKIV